MEKREESKEGKKLSESWSPRYLSPTYLLVELLGREVVGFLWSVEPAAIQPLERDKNFRVKDGRAKALVPTHKAPRAIFPQLLNEYNM